MASYQMVDASSDSEAIIEGLTSDNLALQAKIQQLSTAMGDLEEAAELMDELDASQRADITSLRRELENRGTEIQHLQSEIAVLRSKIDEITRSAESYKDNYEACLTRCRALQADLDAMAAAAISEAEKKREQRAMLCQRALVFYADRFLKLRVESAKLQRLVKSQEARLARVVSLLPAPGSSVSGSLGFSVGMEMKCVDFEISAARVLDLAADVRRHCLSFHKTRTTTAASPDYSRVIVAKVTADIEAN